MNARESVSGQPGRCRAAGELQRHFDLPGIDTAKLAVLNALYASHACRAGDLGWHWQSTAGLVIDHWARMTYGDKTLWLGLAPPANPDVDFSWQEFNGMPRQIAWCAANAPVLEMLHLAFGMDWLPSGIQQKPEADVRLIDAGFVVARNDRRIAAGRCRFSADCLPSDDGSSAGPTRSIMRRLPLEIPIVVDRVALAASELQKLEIGAVVRVSRRAFLDIGAHLNLRVGGSDVLAKVVGTRLTVVDVDSRRSNAANNRENEMTTIEDQPGERSNAEDEVVVNKSSPIDVASMPVELCFEAGRLRTRYSELSRIQPGYTYELGHTLGERAIDITANGALIARGELVNIGDQLGVRITALGRGAYDVD